jgi:hypothetical protein
MHTQDILINTSWRCKQSHKYKWRMNVSRDMNGITLREHKATTVRLGYVHEARQANVTMNTLMPNCWLADLLRTLIRLLAFWQHTQTKLSLCLVGRAALPATTTIWKVNLVSRLLLLMWLHVKWILDFQYNQKQWIAHFHSYFYFQKGQDFNVPNKGCIQNN